VDECPLDFGSEPELLMEEEIVTWMGGSGAGGTYQMSDFGVRSAPVGDSSLGGGESELSAEMKEDFHDVLDRWRLGSIQDRGVLVMQQRSVFDSGIGVDL